MRQVNENSEHHRYLLAAGWTYEGKKHVVANHRYFVKYWSHPDHGSFLKQVDAIRIQQIVTPPLPRGKYLRAP